MRRRSNLVVLLGLGFFVTGVLVVYLITRDDGGTGSSQTVDVKAVVGTEDIPAGALADDLLEAGKLELIDVPAAELSPGAIQSLEQIAGATFVQGFAKRQQITVSGLQLQNRTFKIPDGFEAVAVQVDFVAGAAGYVNAGDHINLYGVYATPVGGRPAPRAELLLTNVEVLDVDLSIPARRGSAPADPSQPAAPRASGSTVTYLLALRPLDAEKVIYSTEFASLYATLVGDKAPPAGPTPGRDPENILAQEPNDAFGG